MDNTPKLQDGDACHFWNDNQIQEFVYEMQEFDNEWEFILLILM
jgi:hypothetical protein